MESRSATSDPVTRIRENITSATALLVIGVGIIAYAAGFPFFWVIFAIGLLVIVPLVGLLFGADDWRKWDPLSDEFWEDIFGESEESPAETTEEIDEIQEDALEILRSRYAKGELTDEQFERKLETLLEVRSMEDVEDRFASPDRELARE